MRLPRFITGDDLQTESKPLPPLVIDPPVSYKPGTESAQWGEFKPNNSPVARFLRRFGMEW